MSEQANRKSIAAYTMVQPSTPAPTLHLPKLSTPNSLFQKRSTIGYLNNSCASCKIIYVCFTLCLTTSSAVVADLIVAFCAFHILKKEKPNSISNFYDVKIDLEAYYEAHCTFPTESIF